MKSVSINVKRNFHCSVAHAIGKVSSMSFLDPYPNLYNAAMEKNQWQLYRTDGQPIRTNGASIMQVAIHGLLHGSAHVWIWRRTADGEAEVLLQKRPIDNIKWPGLLDKSAGGHIWFNESPVVTAIRKTRQELGILLTPLQLTPLGRIENHVVLVEKAGLEMIEYEFQWIYVVELADTDIHIHTKASVAWRSICQLRYELMDYRLRHAYARYGTAYYATLIQAIEDAACC